MKRFTVGAALFACGVMAAIPLMADDRPAVRHVHFIIPGGAGGGWDGTARGTGQALLEAGLIRNATYEHISGGGGGRAIGFMVENAESLTDTIMVNSTPIVMRSLIGVFPYNFRDLSLISSIIGDYAAIVVPADSSITTMTDLVTMRRADPQGTAIGGGSVPGGMDHLVAAMVFKASGDDPTELNYIPYDAGGVAMAALLSGEIDALSTGFSEAVSLAQAGQVRIIGVTAPERVEAFPDAPTMVEQGIEAEFVNWRGFFGPPGLDEDRMAAYQQTFLQMYDTAEWEAVRAANGWVNIHNAGPEFLEFLEEQEEVIGGLMRELGFL